MRLLPLFVLFSLACCCEAGPVVAVIVRVVAAVIGPRVATAIAGSSLAKAFGVGASGIWYGKYVIINGALYTGSGAAAGGTLGAGAVAGGVASELTGDEDDYEKVEDPEESKSVVASIESESRAEEGASKASEASRASKESASKASKASKSSKSSAAAAKASEKRNSVIQVMVLSKIADMVQSLKSSNSAARATVTAPPPPGSVVSRVPPRNRPSEVPPGVPDYNFRMCQNDMIAMGQKKQDLIFDNPTGFSLRVDNIPATCMVLSSVMHGDPTLGPHPIVMGSSSLQWDNIEPETINTIRKAFGLPPR